MMSENPENRMPLSQPARSVAAAPAVVAFGARLPAPRGSAPARPRLGEPRRDAARRRHDRASRSPASSTIPPSRRTTSAGATNDRTSQRTSSRHPSSATRASRLRSSRMRASAKWALRTPASRTRSSRRPTSAGRPSGLEATRWGARERRAVAARRTIGEGAEHPDASPLLTDSERRTGAAPRPPPSRNPSRSGRESGERRAARVHRGLTEFFFDPQELIVLGDSLAPGGRARLDLPAVGRDGEVGDRRVLGLT